MAVPSNVPRFQTILVLVALAVMVPLAARAAFFESFGTFEPWDDEGYAMITVASCSRGFALYDQVFSQYGPFFYLVTWLGFDVGPLQLDHATIRWVVMCAWLAIALAVSAVVWKISRNAALVAIVFVVSFAHVHWLADEPGHPQSLVVFCVTLVVIVPTLLARARPRLCCTLLGVLCAAIALTKINIGAYVTLAVVLAITEHLPTTALARWTGRASWAAAICLPWAVMHARLNEPWVLHYAAAVTGTVVLVAASVRFSGRAPLALFRTRDVLAFGIAFSSSAAAILAFALVRGTSVHGLIEGVLLDPLALAEVFVLPLDPDAASVQALVGSAALWIIVRQLMRRPGRGEAFGAGILAATKLVFGSWVLTTAWRGNPSNLIEAHAPFLWLFVFPLPGRAVAPARVFLAVMAALQLMHAFPVAGSQKAWATLLLMPVAGICVADAWEHASSSVRRLLPGSVVPTLLHGTASVALVICAVGLMHLHERTRRQGYGAHCALDLPGTGPLRVGEADAAVYACLTRNIAAADAFYALPGMNSFYFWARKDPPTPINATVWHAVLPPRKQELVRAALEPHEKLLTLVGLRFAVSPWLSQADPERQPLANYIRTSTASLGQMGIFEVRARREWTPQLVDCARIDGDTIHVRVGSREGVHVARIVVVDAATGILLSDSESGGDGAAWQRIDDAGLGTVIDFSSRTLDLARDRHFALHGSASLATIRASRSAVVRLLDARSEVVARLPFLRPP